MYKKITQVLLSDTGESDQIQWCLDSLHPDLVEQCAMQPYGATSMDQGNRDVAVRRHSTHVARPIQTCDPKDSSLSAISQ
jgi:hypothetical protein